MNNLQEMKPRQSSWDSYWSAESPKMIFKVPSESLKGKQILTIVLLLDGERHPYSISYNKVYDRGSRGAAKDVAKHFEKIFFDGDRAFNHTQFNDLVGLITDWKMDIDKEFSFFPFLTNYWWDPFTDKLVELWVRIFNR